MARKYPYRDVPEEDVFASVIRHRTLLEMQEASRRKYQRLSEGREDVSERVTSVDVEVRMGANDLYDSLVGRDKALKRRISSSRIYSPNDVREIYLDTIRLEAVLNEIDSDRGLWPHIRSEVAGLREYWEGFCKDKGIEVSKDEAFKF